jgi:hypothetical protein
MDPGAVGGGALEDGDHDQPALVLAHGHAHAVEATADRLVEDLRLLGREVVGETVSERADHAADGGTLECVAIDFAVEVVLDRLDQLGAQRAVVLHKRRAKAVGEPGRMAAEPDAGEEDGDRAQKRGGERADADHGRGAPGGATPKGSHALGSASALGVRLSARCAGSAAG